MSVSTERKSLAFSTHAHAYTLFAICPLRAIMLQALVLLLLLLLVGVHVWVAITAGPWERIAEDEEEEEEEGEWSVFLGGTWAASRARTFLAPHPKAFKEELVSTHTMYVSALWRVCHPWERDSTSQPAVTLSLLPPLWLVLVLAMLSKGSCSEEELVEAVRDRMNTGGIRDVGPVLSASPLLKASSFCAFHRLPSVMPRYMLTMPFKLR